MKQDSLANKPTAVSSFPDKENYVKPNVQKTSESVKSVKAYLQQAFKNDIEKGMIDSGSRKFVVFEYDLNDDGKNEVFVGLTGSWFCGSGGCNWLLLNDNKKLITEFTVSKFPVFVSLSRTKGWKDLIINSDGNRIIKFDGHKYPSNPSVAPIIDKVPKDCMVIDLDIIDDGHSSFSF